MVTGLEALRNVSTGRVHHDRPTRSPGDPAKRGRTHECPGRKTGTFVVKKMLLPTQINEFRSDEF
jgi:hypothetical protein